MDEIKQLREALCRARTEDWVTAALSALDELGMSFCGKSNAAVSADSLDHIYSVRLTHCHEGVCSHIEALLSALRKLPGSTPIFTKPFLCDSRLISSFWSSGHLIACITGPPDPPEHLAGDLKSASRRRNT
jgi:hypothetical protein